VALHTVPDLLSLSFAIAEPPAYYLAADAHDLHPSFAVTTPPPPYVERIARKFRILSPPGEGILNSSILDAVGRPLYITSSDPKLKKTSVRRLRASSGTDSRFFVTDEELARFGWDRSSPRVRFGPVHDKKRNPKVKCKEWLPKVDTGSSNVQSRVLTFDGIRYTVTEHKGGAGYLLRADDIDPSLPLARWCTTLDGRSQRLEVFEDAYVIPGLFDAFVLALVVLQCEQPLGDAPDCLNWSSPKFYGMGTFQLGR